MSRRRLQPCQGLIAGQGRGSAGFSLVELMVSMVLFTVVSAGSLGLFTISTRQANLTRQLQEEEFAIRLDLATIQALNDRYTCASGTCLIDSNGEPPGQNDYYPTTAATQSSFASLCSSVSDSLLLSGVSAFNLDTTSDDQRRTYRLTLSATNGVTYSNQSLPSAASFRARTIN